MKNYKEVADDVLRRSAVIIVDRRRKRRSRIRIGSGAVCLCLIALLGFGIWSDRQPPRTVISSYGDGPETNQYAAPENGTIQFSDPLKSALAEYEDSVLYKVIISIYKDQQSDMDGIQEERDRLIEWCVDAGIESGDGWGPYITLYLTKEQLMDFAANDQYGYVVRLYAEQSTDGRPKYYTRAEISEALIAYLSGEKADEELLEAVLMPTSMEIRLPKLNVTWIYDETPLQDVRYSESYYEDLYAHGVSLEEAENMTVGDYTRLHDGWTIGQEEQENIAEESYFEGRDLSTVTWWEYNAYLNSRKKSNDHYSEEELAELTRRGVLEGDAEMLWRSYFSDPEIFSPAEAVLAESDAVLKEKLEKYYRAILYQTFGEETANAIIAAAES